MCNVGWDPLFGPKTRHYQGLEEVILDIMAISGFVNIYRTFQVERHRSSKSLCNIGIFPIRGDETRLEKGIERSEATGSDFRIRKNNSREGIALVS